ncbi:MAG: DUF1552 domain-containing protein [Vicinamibacterales bacterium]
MMISKKALSRRTVLRGLGTTLALPLLDSMLPAFTAVARSAAAPISRFGVMYVPNGMIMQNWAPIGEGVGYQFNTTMVPLTPFRNQMTVISGLNCTPPPGTRAGDGVHARASTRFLTDVYPKITPSGGEIRAGISMDQILAKEMGKHTQLGSLEMAIESTQSAGACDQGYACDYTSTICWRGDTTPMPMENNPRAVFERLFGDTGSTDPKARLSRIQQDRSILDSVTAEVAHLQQSLGHGDRSKLNEYLDAIRDVERRIQKAEEQSEQGLPLVTHPAGIPGTYDEHAKLLIDLQVLAYQCDLTRIITLMMGREFSGMTYPHIGVPDAHHPISHHQNQVDKVEKVAKINLYHVTLFAYLLEKLSVTADGDGSLLDHVTMMYGAGMADSNRHAPVDLPLILAGGGAGRMRNGRHIRYPSDTPLANLHLTLLDKFGVQWDRLGDSTGKLDDLHLNGI